MFEADLPELGVVRIARPCSQLWSKMEGDQRKRLCAACKSHVFNFSELSSEEARQLVRSSSPTGRICARIFKRLDGTVMTKDCPRGYSHGWQYARKRMPSVTGAGLVCVALLALWVGTVTIFGDNIRLLFGMSTGGALAGSDVVEAPPREPMKKKLIGFSLPEFPVK